MSQQLHKSPKLELTQMEKSEQLLPLKFVGGRESGRGREDISWGDGHVLHSDRDLSHTVYTELSKCQDLCIFLYINLTMKGKKHVNEYWTLVNDVYLGGSVLVSAIYLEMHRK